MANYKIILNAALFQAGWFACVLGGDLWALAALAAVWLLHYLFVSREPREWCMIFAFAAAGISIDSLLFHAGTLLRSDNSTAIPLWLMALWGIFPTTVHHCLGWLRERRGVTLLCGAIAVPLSYYGGAQLSQQIVFAEPVWQSLLLLGMIWALWLRFMMRIECHLWPTPEQSRP
ncbi:DUF2878 domain-containing protein [Aestuariirhabdus sp. LZHN29]|uniref:DUF2878 domain-containing protein n=1 Tax=Aestuariirhabdus sp. LZHN29 TaxID=3417462 RepID=UPI003CE99412